MSYRVETASSGRAVCKATECKDAGVKIELHELRFGVWVNFEDRGSWAWKHWGCVTGAQLQNLRDYLLDEATGQYRWDALDGYEGDEKNSLDKTPDLQDKVRRVITQGFIDPEDWNGDAEMNKLGEKGLRTKETKRKMMEDKRKGKHEIAELEQQMAALAAENAALRAGSGPSVQAEAELAKMKAEIDEKSTAKGKATSKKRVRAEGAEDEVKPAKKKRATKAKKEEDGSDVEEKPKPARKSRAKKAVKKEESDAELPDLDAKVEDIEEKPKIAKKPRANEGVKREEDAVKEEHIEIVSLPSPPAAKKTARGKRAVKKEEDVDEVAPVKKEPVKRGRKKPAPKEESDDEALAFKDDGDVKAYPGVRGESSGAVNGVSGIPQHNSTFKDEDSKSVKEESKYDKLSDVVTKGEKFGGSGDTTEDERAKEEDAEVLVQEVDSV